MSTSSVPTINQLNDMTNGNVQLSRYLQSLFTQFKNNNGFFQGSVDIYTSAQTLDENNYIVLADCSGGAFSINLPEANTAEGRTYLVKKVDSSGNGCVVRANGTETIEGLVFRTLVAQWDDFKLVCDGASWLLF